MPFTAAQKRTLVALIDCIIPADEFPSASQNGVVDYLDRILDSDLRDRAADVGDGLVSLDREATARHGRAFAELDDASRVTMLRAIEGSPFFELMVTLANEGYYTDPTNGSNLDAVSWKMIGYDPRVPAKPAKEKWLEGLA
jgi:gluconate 2-dehydrogenase subunit 3-like protein